MAKKKIEKITDLRPQRLNANKHSQRGLGLLEDSIARDGWIGAITVAADGETFDGSARIETGAANGFDDAIVVRSDGSKPVVVVREDIATADDPKAKRLGIAANRVVQVDLAWDTDVLAEIAAEQDLSDLFTADEFASLTGQELPGDDPNDLWQGMPEFEQEDADAFRMIKVRFDTQEAVDEFARLIKQTITAKTKSIWHPHKAPDNLKEYTVQAQ